MFVWQAAIGEDVYSLLCLRGVGARNGKKKRLRAEIQTHALFINLPHQAKGSPEMLISL
jgi:hypothetical protein